MKTTLGIPTLTEQDVEEFVLLLSEQDEVRCEYQHLPELGYCECSGKVVYRVFDCKAALLECQNAGEETLRRVQKVRCHRCYRPAVECWRVVPV